MIWDEVLVRARSDATLTLSLVVFMVIAAVIAAVGILTDSPILIVGAMVVSPDFNPISALTVALFLGQRPLAGRAAATLAWGFLFAVAATMVLTFVVEAIDRVPEVFAFDQRILTSFISRPNGFSAVVALIGRHGRSPVHHGVEGRHAGRGVHLRHDHPGGRRHGRAPGGRQLGTGLGGDPSARRSTPRAWSWPVGSPCGCSAGSWRGWQPVPVDRAAGTRGGSGQLLDEGLELAQVAALEDAVAVWMPYSPTIESPVSQ